MNKNVKIAKALVRIAKGLMREAIDGNREWSWGKPSNDIDNENITLHDLLDERSRIDFELNGRTNENETIMRLKFRLPHLSQNAIQCFKENTNMCRNQYSREFYDTMDRCFKGCITKLERSDIENCLKEGKGEFFMEINYGKLLEKLNPSRKFTTKVKDFFDKGGKYSTDADDKQAQGIICTRLKNTKFYGMRFADVTPRIETHHDDEE